jgi:hypothetical protein
MSWFWDLVGVDTAAAACKRRQMTAEDPGSPDRAAVAGPGPAGTDLFVR